MSHKFFYLTVILLTTSMLFSCVGKKKFLYEVSKRETCDSTLQVLNNHNLSLNRKIAGLELQLAEKTGERNAFREIIDKKESLIEKLESELENVTNKSLNKQESLDNALEKKNQQLAEKNAVIGGFISSLEKNGELLQGMMDEIIDSLGVENLEGLDFAVKNGIGRINIDEKRLFRPGSLKLKTEAYSLLEIMANVFVKNPAVDLQVIGHTDNEPVKSRSLDDNWDLSVLRATPVVRAFTKEFGINPNQIVACGKGDSKPKSSNATSEGREQNRRTEILLLPPTDKVIDNFVKSSK